MRLQPGEWLQGIGTSRRAEVWEISLLSPMLRTATRFTTHPLAKHGFGTHALPGIVWFYG